MNLAFKHILVPFDGSVQSEVALNSAIFFTQKYNSQLTVVHIEESSSDEGIKPLIDKGVKGAEYTYIHKHGKPFKGIIEASMETDADLIIMGTHGISGFEEFWMGSNAYKVVNLAKCPVLTMREDGTYNDFKSIVLPIDTSFESRQKVPFAIGLARQFQSTIHVYGVSVDNDKESESQINGYVRQVKNSLEEEGINFTVEKKLGQNITNATIEYATRIKADLIIIMTEQEAQIGSFFLGKFAQQMVNHSPVPVISIAPREDMLLTDARL
jgi:nucleotide-binding universal stress UspA family protein